MKIAAFNVKQLGIKKINDDIVRKNLIKIVSRYSVVVMLEVMDSTCRAMNKFLAELNKTGANRRHQYDMKYSRLLGRSTYKERFVFFYRTNEVTVTGSYQYVEAGRDVLAREPFILQFNCPNTVVQDLVLIPVHTKPTDAEKELNALRDVVEAVRSSWNTDNIMILGDFNADGRYLSERKLRASFIRQRPYRCLIDDDVDTTTNRNNDNTYDRIVVYGDKMYKAVLPDSAQAFDFQIAYGLDDETTQSISDHFPVEVELKTRRRR